jgi:hypothetical protein
MARIGPEEVRKRCAVDPKQVPDFIALRGDPSDKLPRAAGVGPKGAADLLWRYGTLDGVLDAGRFPAQAKMLRLYRSIATMDASAPLPSLGDQAPTWPSHRNWRAAGVWGNWLTVCRNGRSRPGSPPWRCDRARVGGGGRTPSRGFWRPNGAHWRLCRPGARRPHAHLWPSMASLRASAFASVWRPPHERTKACERGRSADAILPARRMADPQNEDALTLR